MTKLLNCPFCNSKAEHQEVHYPPYELGHSYHEVFCSECEIEFKSTFKDVSVKQWNTRPNPWIRVEDELPTTGEYVLIREPLVPDSLYHTAYYTDGVWKEGYYGNVLDHVTHWKPITEVKP